MTHIKLNSFTVETDVSYLMSARIAVQSNQSIALSVWCLFIDAMFISYGLNK